MSQVSRRKMNPLVAEKAMEVFCDVLTSPAFSPQKSSFIELFMTPTEKIMFSKRIAISILVKRGYSYDLIKDYLKVSQGTIAWVANQLTTSQSSSQNILEKIIRNKDLSKILADFEYNIGSLIPPKGRNWSIWRKNLINEKRLSEIPL